MGGNDAPSHYITLEQFDAAYGVMIQKIKNLASESEIVVCSLPPIPLYNASEQTHYNNVIKKYATDNGFTILYFEKAFSRTETSEYLVDSANPNKTGMNKIAEVATADFFEANK